MDAATQALVERLFSNLELPITDFYRSLYHQHATPNSNSMDKDQFKSFLIRIKQPEVSLLFIRLFYFVKLTWSFFSSIHSHTMKAASVRSGCWGSP